MAPFTRAELAALRAHANAAMEDSEPPRLLHSDLSRLLDVAEEREELLTIARSLAVALCLGQRGHGYSGERLTDLEEARRQCAKLLGLFGETGPFCYHKRRLGER